MFFQIQLKRTDAREQIANSEILKHVTRSSCDSWRAVAGRPRPDWLSAGMCGFLRKTCGEATNDVLVIQRLRQHPSTL